MSKLWLKSHSQRYLKVREHSLVAAHRPARWRSQPEPIWMGDSCRIVGASAVGTHWL